MAKRQDKATITTGPKRLANGHLRTDASLTRTGVFKYLNPDGSIRAELRCKEEVFDQASLDSFKLIPFTDDHPTEMVDGKNARGLTVGAVGSDVRQDGNEMVASVAVFDAGTIKKIDSGKRELSLGYDCDLDMTPGVSPEGEHYDCIQRNIRGNHLALVDRGRAGTARLRMDAAVMIDNEGETKMDFEKLYNDEKARADRLEGERDAAKAEAVTAVARADAAEKARTDALVVSAEAVNARVDLLRKVSTIIGSEPDSKLDDRALKALAIKHADNFEITEKHNSGYVDGRFDTVAERFIKNDEKLRTDTAIFVKRREDAQASGDDAEKLAMQKMKERTANRHKTASKEDN